MGMNHEYIYPESKDLRFIHNHHFDCNIDVVNLDLTVLKTLKELEKLALRN